MSLIWMPAQTTRPPGATALSAAGTRAPTGAKMMAASSGSGGGASDGPARAAPSERAKTWAVTSSGKRPVNRAFRSAWALGDARGHDDGDRSGVHFGVGGHLRSG